MGVVQGVEELSGAEWIEFGKTRVNPKVAINEFIKGRVSPNKNNPNAVITGV